MSKWKYTNNDGKHIINNQRGVLIAIVCDEDVAIRIVDEHEENEQLRKELEEAQKPNIKEINKIKKLESELNAALSVNRKYQLDIQRLSKELEEAQQWRSKYDSKHALLIDTDASKNELDRMYREALEAAHILQKELEEERMIKFPRQPIGKYGWELDFDYLQKIQAEMQRETEHSINLEEIEAVLLTLERVGREGNQCK